MLNLQIKVHIYTLTNINFIVLNTHDEKELNVFT